jgi:hypothetical protein
LTDPLNRHHLWVDDQEWRNMRCVFSRSHSVLIADDMNDWHEGDPPAPLPFERRRHPRRPLQGAARAVLLDAAHFGQFRQLALLDYSDGGVGALTSTPIHPGTELSVTLSRPVPSPSAARW